MKRTEESEETDLLGEKTTLTCVTKEKKQTLIKRQHVSLSIGPVNNNSHKSGLIPFRTFQSIASIFLLDARQLRFGLAQFFSQIGQHFCRHALNLSGTRSRVATLDLGLAARNVGDLGESKRIQADYSNSANFCVSWSLEPSEKNHT